ncbi:MAG TPA: hydroxymethylbilane synthase [Vicinamibacterales bacterium]|nr:hydroxymethylbilane synthase [Vicinamibacterales bacterium]
MSSLRLGTRGSQLARYQARTVAARIAAAGGPACEVVIIQTSGDRLQDAPLADVGGKRLFVKELEDALLGDRIDLAVHSSKDMPAVLPDGLAIAAVLPREDPRDALVLPAGAAVPASPTLDALVAALGGAPRIGTGSVRRVAQLRRLAPNAQFAGVRGNLDTRLRKLDEGQHDALVLAAAGLYRLGFASRITAPLPASACVPAPGQGIIAVEIRAGDGRTHAAVSSIDDAVTSRALAAERALVRALGGGCQMPLGALAQAAGDDLDLRAVVLSIDGARALHHRARGPKDDPEGLGARVAEALLKDGAGELLAEVRRAQAAIEGLQP